MNGAMMFSSLFSRFAPGPDPRAIEHEGFEQAVKAGECVVVDVREALEFATARIPGSLNMPLSRFDPSRLPSEKPVVLICHSCMRSRRALGQAHAAGREDVKHYSAGLVGWHSRGALAG
jgi:rhodanese-related sulfurtransferase